LLNAGDDPTSPHYHPYWYARVIKIFHVLVATTASDLDFQLQQILWVRWLGRSEERMPSGAINPNTLDRVGFVSKEDATDMFRFIDPKDVVRACHLLPAFAHGYVEELPPESLARPQKDAKEDWAYFYVNRFVDRDMYMRFNGGGVGH
ncbi:hypothetical protein M422DRAFT_84985, partial [Sphaerobolus stellatus SS14]